MPRHRTLALALLVAACALPARAEEAPSGTPAHEASGKDAPETAVSGGDGAAPSAWPTTRTPMPFDVMRSVQALQDQVARGNAPAIRVQALLLRRFMQSFLQADPAVWQDERNRRAAILFTLSGGPPELLEGLQRENLLGAGYEALVQGALLYVRNDLQGAYKQFALVDPMSIESVLGGQISLAMGQIQQFDKPLVALEHLDQARLLAPGGLIEEAALRLEALLANDQKQEAQADHLARRYFDRYADSTYAANFEARFASIMTDRARTDATGAFESMSDVVAGLPEDRQVRLFLAVARRSLVEGNLAFAQLGAARALTADDLSPADRTRGRLYEVASTLAALGLDEGARQLAEIDRSMLHPEDALLLDAAYRVLDGIGAPDMAVAETPADDVPILARAEQALSASAGALETDHP